MNSKFPFWKSVLVAFRGMFESVARHRNLGIQLGVAAGVIVAGGWFGISRTEWVIVALCIGTVISAEVMNTAFEAMVDLLEPKIREEARRAKDYAAGAVLVISLAAAVIGGIIFGPHVWVLLNR